MATVRLRAKEVGNLMPPHPGFPGSRHRVLSLSHCAGPFGFDRCALGTGGHILFAHPDFLAGQNRRAGEAQDLAGLPAAGPERLVLHSNPLHSRNRVQEYAQQLLGRKRIVFAGAGADPESRRQVESRERRHVTGRKQLQCT